MKIITTNKHSLIEFNNKNYKLLEFNPLFNLMRTVLNINLFYHENEINPVQILRILIILKKNHFLLNNLIFGYENIVQFKNFKAHYNGNI